MKRKKIILSYDYELFFGIKSGTVQKTLIEPTNLLLDRMDSVGAKGNFFIDYLMLERLEQLTDERAKADLKQIKDQVKDMVLRGHRIELHLHPHWIDAKYNGDGTWDFSNYTHYSLYSLERNEILRQFKEGISYLTTIAREIDPDYKICAFRAGGWTIQPFKEIKDGFVDNGIIIDSSVMCGVYQDNKFSRFDFKNAPNKEFYRFEDDVCMEVIDGQFVEVPISMYNKHVLLKILHRILRIFIHDKPCITDGTHLRYDLPDSERLKFYKPRKGPFSLSGNIPIMFKLFYFMSNKSLLTIIEHPKDFKYSALSVLKFCMKYSTSITYYDLYKRI